MRELKDCPDCSFRPSLNARICSGCGHYFDDVAPVWIRNWIATVARHLRREEPGLDASGLRRELERRLLQSEDLLDALRRTDPSEPPEEGLLGEVKRGLQHLWTQVTGPEKRRADQIRWAIQEALEEMERQLGQD